MRLVEALFQSLVDFGARVTAINERLRDGAPEAPDAAGPDVGMEDEPLTAADGFPQAEAGGVTAGLAAVSRGDKLPSEAVLQVGTDRECRSMQR